MIARLTLLLAAVALLATPAPRVEAQATPVATPVAERGYARPELLVDAAWLKSNIGAPNLKVVALTPSEDFAAGHIPGAAQIDWPDLEIVETSAQGIATWRGEVEQRLTALGLSPDDTVVYDNGTLFAAWLWWVLVQLGHKDVRLLDGGFAAWLAAGGEVETGPSRVKPAARPYRGTLDESAIASIEEVEASLRQPRVVLADARSEQEYVAGHLPGAIRIEFTENAAPDQPKYWKSAAELRALYMAADVTPDRKVIPYCLTGVRSAVTYFTLRLIGFEDVSPFTGSWKKWSSHPELPKAMGDRP